MGGVPLLREKCGLLEAGVQSSTSTTGVVHGPCRRGGVWGSGASLRGGTIPLLLPSGGLRGGGVRAPPPPPDLSSGNHRGAASRLDVAS